MNNRVWILSDKRWAYFNEMHWIAEISIDPDPDNTDPDESVWDRVVNKTVRCIDRAHAIKTCTKMVSNVIDAGAVYARYLRQIEGDVWDWVNEDREEIACIFKAKGSK